MIFSRENQNEVTVALEPLTRSFLNNGMDNNWRPSSTHFRLAYLKIAILGVNRTSYTYCSFAATEFRSLTALINRFFNLGESSEKADCTEGVNI